MKRTHERSIIAEHLMFGEQGLTDVIRFKACDKKIYGFAATFKHDGMIMCDSESGDNTRDIDSALVSHTAYAIRPFQHPPVVGDETYNPESVYAGYENRWGTELLNSDMGSTPTTLDTLPKKIAQAPASAVDGFNDMFKWDNFIKHTTAIEKVCVGFVFLQIIAIVVHPILRLEYAIVAPIVSFCFNALLGGIFGIFSAVFGG